MKRGFRFFRNILYFFKSIKEVRDSNHLIYYKCLKCNSEIIGYKQYGKLQIVCKCGHLAKVYTGKNIHFRKSDDEYTKTMIDKKAERVKNERRIKVQK